jgi:hypothetical protein
VAGQNDRDSGVCPRDSELSQICDANFLKTLKDPFANYEWRNSHVPLAQYWLQGGIGAPLLLEQRLITSRTTRRLG